MKRIQNTWFIQAYLEPETYLVSFQHIIQVLLRSNLCIFWTSFRQTQTYLELWLIYTRNVSRIIMPITLEYVINQYFMQNKEFSNLEPKMFCV